MAAKRTPELLPYCHPIALTSATVTVESDDATGTIRVEATVKARDRTGVEMEALTAAAVTALSLYDATKQFDRAAEITDSAPAVEVGREERRLPPRLSRVPRDVVPVLNLEFHECNCSVHILGATVPGQPICCGPTGETTAGGAVLGWLLLAALVIIWGVFLLPQGRFSLSAGSSLEEFERSMDLLAETQRRGPGRWVVMPRKGAPIKDFRDLSKARVRRRRRRILAGLAELSGLFLLMGVFPPLQGMLVPGLILLGLLLRTWSCLPA